jgi:myo-inositol-1(or 4)-monophosphatase
MQIDLGFILQVNDICREAATFIRSARTDFDDSVVMEKSHNSLVSYVDTTSEKILVERLGKLIPGSTFLTEEETTQQTSGEWQWIIDPLDGTTNFIHDIPVFAISVALLHHGEIVAGTVLEVNKDECFYAVKGLGAYLNGDSISVSKKALSSSLVATGFPYYDYRFTDAYLQVLKKLMLETRGIRRLGAAAVDLAYVACGRFDAFFEYSLAPWDVAAGALIVKEAGGIVCDFKQEQNWLHGRSIVACSPSVYDEFLPTMADIANIW